MDENALEDLLKNGEGLTEQEKQRIKQLLKGNDRRNRKKRKSDKRNPPKDRKATKRKRREKREKEREEQNPEDKPINGETGNDKRIDN